MLSSTNCLTMLTHSLTPFLTHVSLAEYYSCLSERWVFRLDGSFLVEQSSHMGDLPVDGARVSPTPHSRHRCHNNRLYTPVLFRFAWFRSRYRRRIEDEHNGRRCTVQLLRSWNCRTLEEPTDRPEQSIRLSCEEQNAVVRWICPAVWETYFAHGTCIECKWVPYNIHGDQRRRKKEAVSEGHVLGW